MGDHHLHPAGADRARFAAGQRRATNERLQRLNDDVARARTLLADTGMTVAREDLALEAAYWAQLPGCFSMRPRKAPITSRNFSAQAAFHNYPLRPRRGQSLGRCARAADHQRALAVLLLAARERPAGSGRRQPQGHWTYLHLRPDRVRQDGLHRLSGRDALSPGRDAGRLRQGSRPGDPGASAGRHVPAAQERSADRFQSAAAAADREQRRVPEGLAAEPRAAATAALSVREEADLDHALHGTLALDRQARRLSRLIEFTDATRSEGVHARLARWCEGAGGDYAWVFDHPRDELADCLVRTTLFGVDVTDFLDNAITRVAGDALSLSPGPPAARRAPARVLDG